MRLALFNVTDTLSIGSLADETNEINSKDSGNVPLGQSSVGLNGNDTLLRSEKSELSLQLLDKKKKSDVSAEVVHCHSCDPLFFSHH